MEIINKIMKESILNRNRIILFLFVFLLTLCLLFTVSSVDGATPPIPPLNEFTGNISDYGINKSIKSKDVTIPKRNLSFSITPNSEPYNKKIKKFSTYNKYTKTYYTIRSYMELFEAKKGGTLILKKGTYTITNAIPIPSNVNLIFEKGVVIKKGTKTGIKKMPPSQSIFQLVFPSKLHKSKVIGKYDGVKNVNIVGQNTIINLLKIKNVYAIVCGHNKNIKIQGIAFQNVNTAHFIEMDATDGISITKCSFIGSKASVTNANEAINIDTPDYLTRGFNNAWSKHDKTPNKNVLIENNVFKNIDRAIGTHKYSQVKSANGKYVTGKGQKYHTNITIRNNYIYNVRSDAIEALNWKNSQIINNKIEKVPKNSKNWRGILAHGVINIKIKSNIFVNLQRPVQIRPGKNTNVGTVYSVTYNTLTAKNMEDLKDNLCQNVAENYVWVSPKYPSLIDGLIYVSMFST